MMTCLERPNHLSLIKSTPGSPISWKSGLIPLDKDEMLLAAKQSITPTEGVKQRLSSGSPTPVTTAFIQSDLESDNFISQEADFLRLPSDSFLKMDDRCNSYRLSFDDKIFSKRSFCDDIFHNNFVACSLINDNTDIYDSELSSVFDDHQQTFTNDVNLISTTFSKPYSSSFSDDLIVKAKTESSRYGEDLQIEDVKPVPHISNSDCVYSSSPSTTKIADVLGVNVVMHNDDYPGDNDIYHSPHVEYVANCDSTDSGVLEIDQQGLQKDRASYFSCHRKPLNPILSEEVPLSPPDTNEELSNSSSSPRPLDFSLDRIRGFPSSVTSLPDSSLLLDHGLDQFMGVQGYKVALRADHPYRRADVASVNLGDICNPNASSFSRVLHDSDSRLSPLEKSEVESHRKKDSCSVPGVRRVPMKCRGRPAISRHSAVPLSVHEVPCSNLHASGRRKGSTRLLWEFLRDLLLHPSYNPRVIKWIKKDDGVFKLISSKEVAAMWGREKNKPNMSYETMGRALRYYYKSEILIRVDGQRLVYRFHPHVFDPSNPHAPPTHLSRAHLEEDEDFEISDIVSEQEVITEDCSSLEDCWA